MNQIAPLFRRFATDQRGATAIEYCLIASLISITILTWATQIGQSVLTMVARVNTGFE